MFLQQLQNLIYATVVTSIDHFVHFVPLLGMSIGIVAFFGGFAVYFWNKKQSYIVPAYYYVGVAVFVVAVDVLARLNIEYVSAITAVSILFLLFSAYGYSRKKEEIKHALHTITNNRMMFSIFLMTVLLSTFFLSKFIFDNGLHDEYQHHAVVEDMLLQGSWPIRDELRYGVRLSDHYHYGWYYVVIFVKLVFPVSTEVALDLFKLFLFIPLLPFFSGLLKKSLKINWYQSMFLSVSLLVQGPALFFFDAYSGNVFFSQGNEIIFEPLFFQLAGITWFGVVCMVAFLVVFNKLIKNNHSIHILLFSAFSLWSLFLLNKAYLMIFIPTAIVLYLLCNQTKLVEMVQREKKMLLILVALFGTFCIGVVFGLKYLSPFLFALLRGSSGIPFVRDVSLWGFPYSNIYGLDFQSVVSLQTLRTFGIVPIIAFIVLGYSSILSKRKFSFLLISLLHVYLWLIPLVFNFSGSELALNKFYIPAMWLSSLVVVYFVLQMKTKMQIATTMLLISSMIAPLAYFASISLPNYQVYWDYSDPITEYLVAQNIKIVASIDDFEYAKYVMNELEIQLISVKTPNINLEEVVDYEITIQEHPNEKPLAQTDTHYLYAK